MYIIMFLESLLFLFLGISIGILFGLIPGLHPNNIILFVPILLSLSMNPVLLIIFIASMAVANQITDFLPSILLSAPDAGNELAVMPGQQMLMNGHGYHAIKLAVAGSVMAVILCIVLFPLLFLAMPFLYSSMSPYIYIFLAAIVVVMILSEKGMKKLIALFCFAAAGLIGLFSSGLPLNSTLILFPVLSGLFGVSMIVMQMRKKVSVPEQKHSDVYVSKSLISRSVIAGSAGGMASGFLPGIGSSEIASLVSIDKNNSSFLVSIGAITAANTVISMLSVWLISKTRSGAAVAISQIADIGFNEALLILAVSLIACGVAAVLTLLMAKKFLKAAEKINYSVVLGAVLSFIIIMTFLFTGLYGLLLLASCASLGIFAILAGIRRSCLMGVLILPTLLFYLPL